MIPLGLTAVASAVDTGIHKQILGSGISGIFGSGTTILLQESGLLIKGLTQTIKTIDKRTKRWTSCKILGTLGASLLQNMLPDKGLFRAGDRITISAQDF